MLKQLGAVVMEMLGSKKFLALIVTVIAALFAKIGWHVDTETIGLFVGLVASAILAQGVADNGKESKKVELAHARIVSGIGTVGDAKIVGLPPSDPRIITPPPSPPPAGYAHVGMLASVSLLAVLTIAACSWWGATGKQDAKVASYDCTIGQLGQLAPIGETLAGQIIAGSLTLPNVEAASVAAGADVGGCLLSHVLDAIPKSHSLAGAAPDIMADFKIKANATMSNYKTSRGTR